jgi:anaerobic ribonucleoside-triphosphate reductase
LNTLKIVPCEIFQRVVGYFRPVSQWNKGKQSEFADRVTVKIPEGLNHV